MGFSDFASLLALGLAACAGRNPDAGDSDTSDSDTGDVQVCQPGMIDPQPATQIEEVWQLPINCVQAGGIGDVDGDGVLDVVYATNYCAGDSDSKDELEIEFGGAEGEALGHFGPYTLPHDSFGTSLAVADLDGDDRAEIVTVGSGGMFVGRMEDAATYSASTVVVGAQVNVAVGDLDGDGSLDLVSGGGSGSVVQWGDGAGGFTAGSDLEGRVGRVFVGEFDGDGIADVALFGASPLVILAGDGMREFVYLAEHDSTGAASLAVGDFDCDGLDDLLLVGSNADSSRLSLATGAGLFDSFSLADLGVAAQLGTATVAADFNGDGALDFAATSTAGLSWLFGDGAGGFPERLDLGPIGELTPELARDSVGDARPELLVDGWTELRMIGVH